jgi:hypothetical protein
LSRWRYGCKRLGINVRYRFNNGLGLFDKYGHLLPDFNHLEGKVQVIRAAKPSACVCIKPVASIYYMRGTDTCEVISLRRYRFYRDSSHSLSAWN